MSSVPHQPHHHFSSTVCEVITALRSQGCSLARSGGCSVDHINVGGKVSGQKESCITGGCSLESLAAAGPAGMWLFLLFLYPQHKWCYESGASSILHSRFWWITIRKAWFFEEREREKKKLFLSLCPTSDFLPCSTSNNLFSHFQFLWLFILSSFQLDSYQLCSVLSSKAHCEQPGGYHQS